MSEHQGQQAEAVVVQQPPQQPPYPNPMQQRPPMMPQRPSPIDELERLARLHASGALTDQEFSAAKARLLGL